MKRFQRGSVVLDPRTRTWNFRWKDHSTGKRRSTRLGIILELPTKAAAENAALPLLVKVNQQVPESEAKATVADVARRYQEERMPSRFSTRRMYVYNLKNYILPKWGNTPIEALKAYDVELWLKGLDLSAKTKQNLKSLLSILIECAMLWEYIPVGRNPMELFTIRGGTKRRKTPRVLSEEEFHSLLDAMNEEPWRTWLLLGICLGGRFSELIGLKWSDIDWQRRELQIQRSVVMQRVDEPKTQESSAPIPLHEELIRALESWRSQTEFGKDEDWIFASPHTAGEHPYTYCTLWRKLKTASKKAGIPVVTAHALRHSYRSWLDLAGTPVGVVQRLMRHSDVRTTFNVYGGALPEALRQANDQVVQMALVN